MTKTKLVEFLSRDDGGATLHEIVCGMRVSARVVRPVLDAMLADGSVRAYTQACYERDSGERVREWSGDLYSLTGRDLVRSETEQFRHGSLMRP